jgi:hypothetical protein
MFLDSGEATTTFVSESVDSVGIQPIADGPVHVHGLSWHLDGDR